ncbi:hypothetical protein J5N97_026376 [Dioscorea zingiberensis]|uniref:Uncharacterized protein n=1 Tax=Dioscorea zingiberensis TaxID=325984 RepID=A0A9D5H6N2_9LILI|nr:hypothetical protein J5N97_026376 [Dioscorea zingiberensis]
MELQQHSNGINMILFPIFIIDYALQVVCNSESKVGSGDSHPRGARGGIMVRNKSTAALIRRSSICFNMWGNSM